MPYSPQNLSQCIDNALTLAWMRSSCSVAPMRIGELMDLDLKCLWDLPMHGLWVKVPLGKLNTVGPSQVPHHTPGLRPGRVDRPLRPTAA